MLINNLTYVAFDFDTQEIGLSECETETSHYLWTNDSYTLTWLTDIQCELSHKALRVRSNNSDMSLRNNHDVSLYSHTAQNVTLLINVVGYESLPTIVVVDSNTTLQIKWAWTQLLLHTPQWKSPYMGWTQGAQLLSIKGAAASIHVINNCKRWLLSVNNSTQINTFAHTLHIN